MKLIRKIYIKLYYRFWNLILFKEKLPLIENLHSKHNLFLYFDYEREFGGHTTQITNEEIKFLLGLLEKYKIKTTWFIVGQIFEKYPESIQLIAHKGHEIGSHTFNHLAPLKQNKAQLRNDFQKFRSHAPKNMTISGFHSPNGLWSYSLFKLLDQYQCKYDVISCKKNQKCYSHQIKYVFKKKRIRLITLGDDWPLFNKNVTSQQVFNYFKNLSNPILPGEIAGIGFHPWVLFTSKQMLEGFTLFLEYIHNSEKIYTDKAENYIKNLQKL